MEEINYTKSVEDWYIRSKNEEDIFVKFILQYISYEVLCKLNGFDKYNLDISVKNKFFEKIDIKVIKELKEILDNKPLISMKTDDEVKLDNYDDFKNILRFINYGRNNLFHGDKRQDSKRDTLIVEYGTILIEPLLLALEPNLEELETR